MSLTSELSKWWVGGVAAGALILPSTAFLLWKAMTKGGANSSSLPNIPLYGEKRAREEKFIFIDVDYVGVVLGRHLRNIRKIEYETRTFINLVSYGPNEMHNIDAARAFENASNNWDNEEDVPSAKDERSHFLRIHAQTKEQITLVELAIEAIIADAKRRKNKGEIKIPAESIGYIIGKNGDRIRKISKQFRVRAQISQDGGEYETVLLEGTPEGIEGAKIRILEIVDRSAQVFGEETEFTVDEQIRQMVELKEKLEENTEMWYLLSTMIAEVWTGVRLVRAGLKIYRACSSNTQGVVNNQKADMPEGAKDAASPDMFDSAAPPSGGEEAASTVIEQAAGILDTVGLVTGIW